MESRQRSFRVLAALGIGSWQPGGRADGRCSAAADQLRALDAEIVGVLDLDLVGPRQHAHHDALDPVASERRAALATQQRRLVKHHLLADLRPATS